MKKKELRSFHQKYEMCPVTLNPPFKRFFKDNDVKVQNQKDVRGN